METLTSLVPVQFRLLIIVAAVAATFGLGYMRGLEHEQAAQQAAAAKAAAYTTRIVVKQGQATAEAEVRYVTEVKTIKEKGDAIVQVIPKFIPIDSCPVPAGVGVLVNSAETGNPIPSTPPAVDAASTPVAAVAEWAVNTVTICKQNSQQLIDLQGWVTQQQELTNGVH